MKTVPETTKTILEALQKTATETLERKRRLGHYTVIWENGRPLLIGQDAPQKNR